MIVEGTVLRGESFEPIEGRVVIEDGEITAIEEERVERDDIVVPAFVNAHTHVGDSIAKEAGAGLTLEELVAPPDGLKHRLLRAADRDELVAGMRASARLMGDSGTAAFLDFREGGVDGVRMFREALDGLPIEGVAFGRDDPDVIDAADGYGASGAADADFSAVRTAVQATGKPFGIHAGEVESGDLDPALDLDPEFLVHVVHPEPHHLDRIEDRGVPVVVCPRSNLATGVGVAPFEELHERTTLALGTDNVMTCSPSMFREMEMLWSLSELDAREVLRTATRAGAELIDADYGVIESGRPAKLIVLDGGSDNLSGVRDPVRAVVRRASRADIVRTIF